jgi:hypothetical protein
MSNFTIPKDKLEKIYALKEDCEFQLSQTSSHFRQIEYTANINAINKILEILELPKYKDVI